MTLILVLPDDRAEAIRAKSRAFAMDETQFIEQCLVRICGEAHEHVAGLELPMATDEKEDAAYWLSRLFRSSCNYKGQKRLSPNWSMKVSLNGKRFTFTFGPDQQQAAEQAAQKYKELKAEGRAA